MVSHIVGYYRAYPRLSSFRPFSSKTLCYACRAYATAPKPRAYNNTNSTPRPLLTEAEASTKTPPIPVQSVLPTQPSPSRINPPASTHPPPLDFPTRSPTEPTIKHYFALGRAYVTFYRTGLKALWTNYRTARALPYRIWRKSPIAVCEAVKADILSRADFQLLRRAKSDLYKLPPFILLFCICGEFTPLVIVFVTGLVPRIIWIPKQVQNAREKARERRRRCESQSQFGKSASAMILRDDLSRLEGPRERDAYKYLAQSLGLYSESLDKFVPFLIPPGFVRRRVDARVKDLEADDWAIARDGGVRDLNKEEVVAACEERGIEILGKEDIELRKKLNSWIEERRTSSKEVGKKDR